MMALNRKVKIDILGQLSNLGVSLKAYLQAGGLVLFRTLGKVLSYSVYFVRRSLAYPVNGIFMGGLDWVFTMIAMWAANFVCVGMIRFWR
jgi:hypothetical protein